MHCSRRSALSCSWSPGGKRGRASAIAGGIPLPGRIADIRLAPPGQVFFLSPGRVRVGPLVWRSMWVVFDWEDGSGTRSGGSWVGPLAVLKLRPGQEVTVYVDPRDPGRAAIDY